MFYLQRKGHETAFIAENAFDAVPSKRNACCNTLQFFTIPIGLFLGGIMADQVCESFMSTCGDREFLQKLFGTGKVSD